MNARAYFILGFTFVTGLFAGGYLYITSFAPDYVQSDMEEITEVNFRVQGQSTGGCQMSGVCPSFILNQNRTYEYIPAYRLQDDEPEVVTGKMDSNVFKEVVSAVETAEFATLQKINTKSCSSYVDGADYIYHIIYEGTMHDLHTCGTDFGDSSLAVALQPLWKQLSVPEATESENTHGLLEGYLRKSFERGE